MNLEEIIINFLCSNTFKYKGSHLFRELLLSGEEKKRYQYYSALYRLKKKKFIEKDGEDWKVLQEGRSYFQKRKACLHYFDSPFEKKPIKNLLLMFDIPETEKIKRNWLRSQLGRFGYTMIQKSVWVGPSPLPPEFIRYLKEIKIFSQIKTFKLAKGLSLIHI
jgi:DNA-binding transcriptional regulator PaaX